MRIELEDKDELQKLVVDLVNAATKSQEDGIALQRAYQAHTGETEELAKPMAVAWGVFFVGQKRWTLYVTNQEPPAF